MIDYGKTKLLIYQSDFVMSEFPVQRGARPKNWEGNSLPLRFRNGYRHEVKVIGVSVCGGAGKSPVFETELLFDGHTKRGLFDEMKAALASEVLRLDGKAFENISLIEALRELAPLLRSLHGHGYSIEELRRLIVGSLKASISDDELADVIFG